MMFAVALWFGGTVSADCPNVDSIADGCGAEECDTPNAPSRDVDTVTVASDGTKITVTVELCGSFNNNTKYRVHFDYKDSNGDLLTDCNMQVPSPPLQLTRPALRCAGWSDRTFGGEL